MERKEFMSLVGISVGAVILQNCLSGCSSKSDPTPSGGTTGGTTTNPTSTGFTGNAASSKGTIDFTIDISTSDYATLKTNGSALVVGDVIVARTKAGNFIALAKACTHEGTTVNFLADQDRFKCPNHGSEFSTTGTVLSAPASSPLKQYTASFDATSSKVSVK
ncbi:QcrA and Rieske domain-containing protein [Flectobacillus roseus]|uniref:QcrA and Rieske domain-containing protein n=1 Tax=Flectobacillus roseus TaxID=502259 RepID=UPI0024B6545A|nr:Rieske (2Fe-2S) protein [Flectobacillus roseus]MDI9869481.1 Rieske (2Fe-2S) protein [Flectobacillus roseus]